MRAFKHGFLGCFGVGAAILAVLVIAAIMMTGSKAPAVGQGDDFLVKVSGPSGMRFSGHIMTIAANGKSVSQSVSGKTPAEYPVTGSMVSTSFQKQVELGRLRVEIMKGDTLAAESETSAVYGVVTASTQ